MTRTFYLFLLTLFSFPLFSEQPFVVITPEKSGTHLLTKAMERMTDKKTTNCWQHTLPSDQFLGFLQEAKTKNSFLQMHALPTAEIINTLQKHSYKVLFLMRDPRDVAVSLLFYIEKGWQYGPFRLDFPYGLLTLDEKLDELITGARYGLSAVQSIIGKRIPWTQLDPNFVYTVHFEKLVGAEGGGTKEAQLQELVNIANHLNISLTEEKIEFITNQLFGVPGEKTFRSGKIQSWKKHFKPQHVAAFKKKFNNELILLGYENDDKW